MKLNPVFPGLIEQCTPFKESKEPTPEEIVCEALKTSARQMLKDPLLHPKEKEILDIIISGNYDDLNPLDAAYSLKLNVCNMVRCGTPVEILQSVECDLVIFPWRWVGKSHKVRNEPNDSNKFMKKLMFKTYKQNLHSRSYKHLIKGRQ